MAVLRLRSSLPTTLFFDDTDSIAKQFLGLVTSTGSVLLTQPGYHARFITDNQHEHTYLCNGKTGIIEKELPWNLPNNRQRLSISTDEDDVDSVLIENTVQLQINSFMQLEYCNPSNIRFAFTCQNEEFQFQLGVHLPVPAPTLIDLTTTKKTFRHKNISINPKLSTNKSNINIAQKQQIQSSRSSDGKINFHQLPMMQELILVRKRIKYLCDSWLKEYRTALGKTKRESDITVD